jgi:hypothetical protein
MPPSEIVLCQVRGRRFLSPKSVPMFSSVAIGGENRHPRAARQGDLIPMGALEISNIFGPHHNKLTPTCSDNGVTNASAAISSAAINPYGIYMGVSLPHASRRGIRPGTAFREGRPRDA